MKTIGLKGAKLGTCVKDAQNERVIITRDGKPVALIVGVEGLDREQLELGTSDRFWSLMAARRKQKAVSRKELERSMAADRRTTNTAPLGGWRTSRRVSRHPRCRRSTDCSPS